MKRIISMATAAFCAATLFSVGSAHAQNDDMPVINNYHIFPNQIVGQTCLENPDNKEIKCAILDTEKVLVPVAQIDVRTHGGRDIYIQFCAKAEDPVFNGFKCQATVDGEMADPGSLDPLEQVSDGTNGVSIYEFCLTWFGETKGVGRHDITEVDVSCEAKATDTDMPVRIDSSVTAVFSR